jgi:hypothetical protein
MLKIPRRRLVFGAATTAAYAALSKDAGAFWQSRDSNYDQSVGGSPPAAIVFVDSVGTGSSNGTDVTSATINSTGANFLVAAVADFGGGTLGTVSDSKSNSWNPLTTFVDGTNLSRVKVSWSKPTTVGSGHTASYTGTQPAIGFAAFSNVNATPFDTEVGTSGTASNPSAGSITPSASGALLIASTGCLPNGTAPTPDSGFTIIASLNATANNFGFGMAYLIETTIVAKNPTWTISIGNPWAATNDSFKN